MNVILTVIIFRLLKKGLLYVLTAKDSNRIIAGAVLLTQDVRCGQSNGKAYYVHNLVAAIGEKNAGKEILQRIEEYTRLQGMHFVRLDCIVGNQKTEFMV